MHIEVDKDLTVEAAHALSHVVKDTIREKIPQVAEVLIHIEPHPHSLRREQQNVVGSKR
jgi:divalent metal cation (Fe/Co/Zn/Cd) transporter